MILVEPDLCPVCFRPLEITGKGWTFGGIYFVTRQCPVRCQASEATIAGEAKREREELLAWLRAGEIRLRRRRDKRFSPRCYICAEPIEFGERYYFQTSVFPAAYAHFACVGGPPGPSQSTSVMATSETPSVEAPP